MTQKTDITELLHSIGIRLGKETLRAIVDDMHKRKLSPTQVFELLVEAETKERARRNLERRSRVATLGAMKPIDRFEWDWPKAIDRDLVERLAGLDFVDAKQNVLLRGPSGLGKTTLAQNLGHLALQKGKRVRFSTIAAALTDVAKHDGLLAKERRMKRYMQPDLLILDELGYVPHDARSADILFHIVSQRHERASTIITTNLAYKKWGEVFDGATSIHATVDRFAQHCHVVDIDGESYRQKRPDPPPAKAAARRR
ncbi:MAG: IS21-like element helper ATPase IstB [bacterium]|jgi:DNA replication protein DnaC